MEEVTGFCRAYGHIYVGCVLLLVAVLTLAPHITLEHTRNACAAAGAITIVIGLFEMIRVALRH